jgi:hypothetical protein
VFLETATNQIREDNFIIMYSESIREKSEIKSDTPNAKIPMISALDIGHFAAKALLNDKNEHNEQRVLGPELITMDQVCLPAVHTPSRAAHTYRLAGSQGTERRPWSEDRTQGCLAGRDGQLLFFSSRPWLDKGVRPVCGDGGGDG